MKAIKVRRTRHAGHCWRRRDELISDVLQWTPSHGRAKAGRPARTYIQQLCEDTGCSPEDLPAAINDKKEWWERVRDTVLAARQDDDDYFYTYFFLLLAELTSLVSLNLRDRIMQQSQFSLYKQKLLYYSCFNNYKKKKNNSMDISSNKQAKSHTRRLGHGYKRETLREELNIFW